MDEPAVTTAPLDVALVGAGRWGRHILRDLVALGARVTVVLPSDRHRDAALEAGAVGVVTSIDDLPGIDGAVVASPTTTHAQIIDALLPRAVPIYVEKPLSDDPIAARRLAEAAPSRLFVMHKWRYHPGIEALAAIAANGTLGEVCGLRCTRIGWGNPHGDVDGIWMLAPHDVSIGLEILGHIPTPRSAVAERVRGTVTGLVALLGVDPWLAIDVSTAAHVQRREIRLICAEGIATLDDSLGDRIAITRGEVHGSVRKDEQSVPISTELPLLRELRAFLDHLRGGQPPKSSAAEGAAEVEALGELRRLAGLPIASVIG